MNPELLFKNLFAKALEDWPVEITFGRLVSHNPPSFFVEGLDDISDEIENRYINHPKEVLMRDLHYRICWANQKLAEFSLRVNMQDLRPETVQKEFEKSMKYGLENPQSLRWGPEDVKLVNDYFAVNYSPEEKNNQ
jgi:hypothetical protein